MQAQRGGPSVCSANLPVEKLAAVVARERGVVYLRTNQLHLACIQAFIKSSKITKFVALAMATHFWPN